MAINAHISALPVVEEGRLCGILTTTDLVLALQCSLQLWLHRTRPGESAAGYGSGITRGGILGSYTYSVAADFVNRPVNYVCYDDAMRFTNWLQNG